jgi:AcrR family transcriptional regulator
MAVPTSSQNGDGGLADVRRAPFAGTRIGARGQRTQQRLLDAALRVFAEDGYHDGSIERIAKLGGCSRVAFYQYFSSKEEVRAYLAAQVARQLSASTEALDPITADDDGWDALRGWIGRYAATYARYQPIFNAYQAAVDGAGAFEAQTVARLQARLAATTLPPRQLDTVIGLLLECLTHTLDVAGIVRAASPDAFPTARVEDAITDVWHRVLCGVVVRRDLVADLSRRTTPAFASDALELLRGDTIGTEQGTRAALLATGRDVFVRLGYHDTRVEDLITAAGVSRGAFYRSFRDKRDIARPLVARAIGDIGVTLATLPEGAPPDRRALRRWLRHYNEVHLDEAAMLRVWVDGALQDPVLAAESAPPLDWGRRRMAQYLAPRGFGDVGTDAIAMVALLGVFGARRRTPAEVDAAAHVIEHGLLGRVRTEQS